MSTYKVLQDIEAEDKLIGPLTLRQCIYAAVALAACWLSFVAVSKHATFLVVIFLPFIGFGVFFAFPWNKQQSTEVWALAKIRFALKPRKRIWNQSGVKELVTVTAPKTLEDPRKFKDISEGEVQSRLKALADTIDSRGWAVKNAPIDMFAQPMNFQQSDRLIDASALPQEVNSDGVLASDDMFDVANSPVARQFQEKIDAATADRRQEMMDIVSHPQQAQPAAQNNWYGTPQGSTAVSIQSQSSTAAPNPVYAASVSAAAPAMPVAATPTAEEEALARTIKAQNDTPQPSYAHLRVIQPVSVQAQAAQQQTQQAPQSAPQAPVTPPVNPAILELANNNDLNVATIAREAHHITSDSTDEVIVSLR